MKKIITTVTTVLTIFALYAQTAPPNAFNYSGVARNANNTPIATQNIGVQFSVLKSNPTTGAVVYSENHFTTTDAFGLFNLSIGTGAVQSGNFANIDWSNDSYFLRVGIDPAGGTNFVTIGATQFLSVPYALYAKSAGSTSSNNKRLSIKFNGVSVESPVISHTLVDCNLNSATFITDSNYFYALKVGTNARVGIEEDIFTTDTISFTNLFITEGDYQIKGVVFCQGNSLFSNINPLPSSAYFVNRFATPQTISTQLFKWNRYNDYWQSVNIPSGNNIYSVQPNNPSITGFNLSFPINLSIEKQ